MEKVPRHNIFNRYFWNLTWYTVPEEFKTDRTYEESLNYYLVFSPLDDHHDSPWDLARIEKYLRDKYRYDRILITREILEKRIHYNVLITSKSNCLHSNGKFVNKFYMDCQHVAHCGHMNRVIDYIFKESKKREFIEGRDYFIYLKN